MGTEMSAAVPQTRPGQLPDGYNDTGEQTTLDWTAVRQRLAESKHFWFSTADGSGAPHARPIWGAWVDDTLYADGGVPVTRWGRDLLANPRTQVHLESATEVVIIDGEFSLTNDLTSESFARVQASYLRRYQSYQPEAADGLFMVKPRHVLAWTNFPRDVTRFDFA
ncbi:MAG: pyridoxamine 5'-phosphate oxidase family protein [Microlunatus sp.]|nr:pyridoxamine 5'-phosphate oxidase family protein [Microlunatus sp.]